MDDISIVLRVRGIATEAKARTLKNAAMDVLLEDIHTKVCGCKKGRDCSRYEHLCAWIKEQNINAYDSISDIAREYLHSRKKE
jgi:hypothetical protein